MLENLLNSGIPLVLYLQSLGNWLLEPMKFFSFLGYEEFFLFVAPAVYWCIDAGLGLTIGLFLMISSGLNAVLKIAFHSPRPYWYDLRVHALSSETSFGLPSGHAQHAVVIWGTLAVWAKRAWGWVAAVAIIFLIGMSRIYLGVHFPIDVVLGWTTGALLVWVLLMLKQPVLKWMEDRNLIQQVLIVFAVSLLIILTGALARLSLGAWTIPSVWLENAKLADPMAAPPDPLALSGLVSNAGVFFGLAVGAIVISAQGGFNTGGLWWKRLLRFPIGLIGVFLLWNGLGAVFPRGEYLLSYMLRYLRYALIGAWVTGFAPAIFFWLGLAETNIRREKLPTPDVS